MPNRSFKPTPSAPLNSGVRLMMSPESRAAVAALAFVPLWTALAVGVLLARPPGVLLPPAWFYVGFTLLPLLSAAVVAFVAAARWQGRLAAYLAVAAGAALGIIVFGAQMRAVVAYALAQGNPRTEGILSNFHVTAHITFGSPLVVLLCLVLVAAAVVILVRRGEARE